MLFFGGDLMVAAPCAPELRVPAANAFCKKRGRGEGRQSGLTSGGIPCRGESELHQTTNLTRLRRN